MKKIFLAMFALIGALILVGCNNDGSDLNIDLDEFIASPTDLAINGTTLTWTAVEDAKGYIVYANDEEVDTVKTNTYDFSSMTEARIIFQVRTQAPRGMQDSALSASVGYVQNAVVEIQAIQAALQEEGMMVATGFAEELVNKGMLSEEVDAVLTKMNALMELNPNTTEMDDYFSAIGALFTELDNVEAIVSAIVKTYLPSALSDEIAQLELQKQYTLGSLVAIQTQIDALNDLLDEIENNPDEIVLAITSTIEYFISVQQMVSTNLVSQIMGLQDVEDPTDLNATELASITDEMASVLQDTMPSLQDMTLMFQVYDILMAVSGSYVQIENPVENYVSKMAAQALYSMEAFINFLKSLDDEYFTDLLAFFDTENSEQMAAAEALILTIKHFAQFKSDNQNLLDTISEVFTDQEKEALYDSYLAGLDAADIYDSGTQSILDSFNFQELLYLDMLFGDSFDNLLDAFVASDGEIVRQIVIAQGFDYDTDFVYNANTSTYEYTLVYAGNTVTGEEYDYRAEYNLAVQLNSLSIFEELTYLLNEVVKEYSNQDYIVIMKYVSNVVLASLMNQYNSMTAYVDPYSSYQPEVPDLSFLTPLLETFFDNSGPDQLELIQNLLKYINDENVFTTAANVETTVYNYYVSEYGNDYTNDDEYYDDDFDMYANMIMIAGFYDDFMSNANRGLLDDIISDLAVILKDDDFQTELSSFTDAEVTELQANISDLLDYLSEGFAEIKDMNASNISIADETYIEAFQNALQQMIWGLRSSTVDIN